MSIINSGEGKAKKNKIKLIPLICCTLLLGGWQKVENTRITHFGCLWTGACSLTINTGHPVTTATQSCRRGIFAWDANSQPHFYQVVNQAKQEGRPVTVYYSEYKCFPGNYPGGNPKPMWFLGIE